MISDPSAREESTFPWRLEHKSFISNPLEGKIRFVALSGAMVAGHA
jgi:hypothetical protein